MNMRSGTTLLVVVLATLFGSRFLPLTTAQTCPPPPGLLSWWPGNDGRDIVGPNQASMKNGATSVAGKVGQAFSFDGTDDYIEAPGSGIPTGNSEYTVEFWVNPVNLSKQVAPAPGGGWYNSFLFSRGLEATKLAQHIALKTDGSLLVLHWASDWDTGFKLTTLNWWHVGVTYDGTTEKAYVNGAWVFSKNLGGLNVRPPNIKFGRHANYSRYFFNGLLDEISIYNRALTTTELKSIFNAGSSGKSKGVAVLGSGSPRIGGVINLDLFASGDAGLFYQVGSSLGTGPIPIGKRQLRLSPDDLLVVTANNYWPWVFFGYRGSIDKNGQATAKINIPNTPLLIGVRPHTAFVTLDPAAPFGIKSISDTFSFSITK